MAKEKVLTKKEQIEELQAEYDRRHRNAKALRDQHNELTLSLQRMDIEKNREIEVILDGLPDESPKGIVDKVLQLPDEKRGQLIGNIDKLKIAADNEKRKADEAGKKRDALENEVHQDRINAHVVSVFKKYFKWIEFYLVTLGYFHDTLLPSIAEAYAFDPVFHTRSDILDLNKTVAVSLESHFRNGSLQTIGMAETIQNIANLGNAYGERLLEKEPSSTMVHPMEDQSYYGIAPSERTN